MGDKNVCLLLNCGGLLRPEQIALRHDKVVVHESGLRQGQSKSPLKEQILKTTGRIPAILLGAIAEGDASPIRLPQ